MLYAGMLKVIILTHSNYYLLIIGNDDTLNLSKDRTVTQAVVMRLLKSLTETGHHIYMDNYYTSPNLFLEMKLAGLVPVAQLVLIGKGCLLLGKVELDRRRIK